jgi:hypothetical protein
MLGSGYIDLRCRFLEEGRRWVFPLVYERDRPYMCESIRFVIIVKRSVRGPYINTNPVRLPPANPLKASPVKQGRANLPACVPSAHYEAGDIHGGVKQLSYFPEMAAALLADRDGARKVALYVKHPSQAIIHRLAQARVSGFPSRPGPSPLIGVLGAFQPACGFTDEAVDVF